MVEPLGGWLEGVGGDDRAGASLEMVLLPGGWCLNGGHWLHSAQGLKEMAAGRAAVGSWEPCYHNADCACKVTNQEDSASLPELPTLSPSSSMLPLAPSCSGSLALEQES